MKPELKPLDDNFILAKGIWDDGLPIIMRVREGIESFVGHRTYSRRYVITWKFPGSISTGMPSAQDFDQMEVFENELVPIFEDNNQSVLAAVVTHCGEREWIFYTINADEAHERLMRMLKDRPRLPIEIATFKDPKWEEYKGIKALVKKTKAG